MLLGYVDEGVFIVRAYAVSCSGLILVYLISLLVAILVSISVPNWL